MYRKLASILVLLLGLSQAMAEVDLSSREEDNGAVDISTKILEANKEISEFLMEGDIAIPKTRNAMVCKPDHCRWKKSRSGCVKVPYTISDDFPPLKKVIIKKAMKSFRKKTCIRFVRYKKAKHKDFLSIESKGGCWSYLGRIGGNQTVSLDTNDCIYQGVIQHELLHTLGFHHEHTRSDRDNYVKIIWSNIQKGKSLNFEKMNTNNLNTTYDYGSIMHYGRYTFSTCTSCGPTIIPFPDPKVKIGQSTDLSKTDIEKINKLYE